MRAHDRDNVGTVIAIVDQTGTAWIRFTNTDGATCQRWMHAADIARRLAELTRTTTHPRPTAPPPVSLTDPPATPSRPPQPSTTTVHQHRSRMTKLDGSVGYS